MKKILLCLFTCDRLNLLKNAVRSIETFFPWGDRIVIDDGSTDPAVKHFLERLCQEKKNWRFRSFERPLERAFGGFYKNMRYALELALEEGYDYCFFFEDDEQFVWKKDDYPEYLDHIFRTCPDAIQIQPLFFRRIKSYQRSCEYIVKAKAYRAERGFSTTAIWNLDIVRKRAAFRFVSTYDGSNLAVNSAYWLREGYRLYFQFDPTVAIVPWVRSGSTVNRSRPSKLEQSFLKESGFILTPLSHSEIDFLKNRDPSLPAFQEYCNIFGGEKVRPIWHQYQFNLDRFYSLCSQTIQEENRHGQSPLRIATCQSCESSRIPPLKSHLDWEPLASVSIESRMRRLKQALKRIVPCEINKVLKRVRMTWNRLTPFFRREYWDYLALKRRLQKERQEIRASF